MNKFMDIIGKLKCFFGFHDYEIMKTDLETPESKHGQMSMMIRKHKCSRCDKETMLSSGLML